MMAAATTDQQHVQYMTSSKSDLMSISSDGEEAKSRSDTSEQDFFDAQSHVSTLAPSENLDVSDPSQDEAKDSTGPKIVDTLVKKHSETEPEVEVEAVAEPEVEQENAFSAMMRPLNKSVSESVIEREIRYQKEREDSLMKEREEALRKAAVAVSSPVASTTTGTTQQAPKPIPLPTIYSAPNYLVQPPQDAPRVTSPAILSSVTISPFNPAETRIALELREMREREEELRSMRQHTLSGLEVTTPTTTVAVDDGFGSIPNTDEGNFSENGSEDKDVTDSPDTRQVVTNDLPVQGEFAHHRTQSVDSTSSGHSSGSGGISEVGLVRRRVVVKPFEDAQDEEVPSYMRKQKETPIEREIRLTKEREEELRREKGLHIVNGPTVSPSLPKQEVNSYKPTNKLISNDPRSVQHRLATKRIQHEIDEATEREYELRNAGMIQTTSEETLDSKVTRFTDMMEYSIEEQDRKMQAVSPSSNTRPPVTVPDVWDGTAVSGSTPEKAAIVLPVASVQSSPLSPRLLPLPPVTPKRFSAPLGPRGQKGMMERFLASRGKLNMNSTPNNIAHTNSFGLNTNVVTFHKPPVQLADEFQVSEENDSYENERSETSRLSIRPKYTPADEKIQNELKDIQRREEELRLQRARMFASSQPNLLTIMDDEEEETRLSSLDDSRILRASQSNPNLLDSTDSKPGDESETSLEDKVFPIGSRKKSPLIAEWESRIQQATDH